MVSEKRQQTPPPFPIPQQARNAVYYFLTAFLEHILQAPSHIHIHSHAHNMHSKKEEKWTLKKSTVLF